MIPALCLLLASFAHIDLINEHFDIPASDWRYVPKSLTAEPAFVDCVFQADRPDVQIRLVMLSETELNAWRMGREHEEMAGTATGPHGFLRISVHDPQTFVAIENRGAQPAGVRLHVFLEQANVHYLSRGRRLAVILISFGVFFGIVTFSARRLLKAVRR